MHNLLISCSKGTALVAVITLSFFQGRFAAFATCDRTFYSCHFSISSTGPSSLTQHLVDAWTVGLAYVTFQGESTFSLCRFLLKDVVTTLLAANQFTGASRFESLLRSTVCLHLGHNKLLIEGGSRWEGRISSKFFWICSQIGYSLGLTSASLRRCFAALSGLKTMVMLRPSSFGN